MRQGQAERRRRARREADRQLAREASFLARAIDLAMENAPADRRLADLLTLVADVAGAAQAAAFVRIGDVRTAYAAAGAFEDHTPAEALAAWLDRAVPGSRRSPAGERASDPAGTGPRTAVTIVEPRRRTPRPAHRLHPRLLALPGKGRAAVALGFRSERGAARLAARVPPALAGHIAVALASLVAQIGSERALTELRQADAERDTFIRTVAHELRTPLSSLGGYLDLALRQDADPEAGRPFLERACDLVEATSTLVADLLELSRLGAGQLSLEPASFPAADTTRAAVSEVQPLALERQITISATFPSRLRAVHADRRRVQQILVNLLANAIKFSPPSTVISVAVRFDGPAVLFTVRDQGEGIDEADRTRIFEPFHRAAGTERVVGTGLGLPIARELAERMGGGVGVASVRGRGSVFAVGLPALAGVQRGAVSRALARLLRAEEIALSATEPPARRTIVGGRADGPPAEDIHSEPGRPADADPGYPQTALDERVGG